MSGPELDTFAANVQQTARAFPYPPTPHIAGALRRERVVERTRRTVRRRRVVAAALALLLLLVAAAAIPPVRAAIVEFLRLGALEVRLLGEGEPAALPALQPVSIVDLGQEMTASEAQQFLGMGAPGYPAALGTPDAVYGQNLLYREPVISYLWQANGQQPQIVLTLIELPNFGIKWAAGEQIVETSVRGRPAVWIEGPHPFNLENAQVDQQVVIAANVLIWSDDTLTYRLEGNIALEEARVIAASLE